MRKNSIFVIFLISILATISLIAQNTKKEKNKTAETKEIKKKDTRGKLPEGFDKIKWGTTLSNAKNEIRGRLYYTDDKEVIISKDGELEYKYGFFFDGKTAEGKFFYLSMKFPYLTLKEVKDRIEAKFGQPSSENISDNQGAIAWDSEKTIIIMWVDRYEKKPFSRRIIYISKEITKELNEYRRNIFNKTEIEILNKLNP